jgi:putative transposase
MTYCPDKHHRRSVRLSGYDYSQNGAYFVTVCTNNRKCLFGEIKDGKMYLNDAGKIVCQCWDEIPMHFPHVDRDVFVVMPNHIHGIVVIDGRGKACDGGTINCRGTACRAPTVERFAQPISGSIPTVMRSFKSAVTKRINELKHTPGEGLWQRNYYEHIIRNESEWNRIRQYIVDNPAQWDMDRENPHAGMVGARHAVPQQWHAVPDQKEF